MQQETDVFGRSVVLGALRLFWIAVAGIMISVMSAVAATNTVTVQTEATIRGGSNADTDQDEVAADYIMVKYDGGLDNARHGYFQFDLSGITIDTNQTATFTIDFKSAFPHAVTLWALDQDYPGFSANITWNAAQANDLTSNHLLTSGTNTATAIETGVLIPATEPYSFTIQNPSNYIINDRLTLVLTGADNAGNDSGGLRVKLQDATVTIMDPPAPVHYDVYLAAGQSNMDGRGPNSDLTGDLASWSTPQDDVRTYYVNPINENPVSPSYDSGWQVLQPGWSVAPGYSGSLPSTTFGPELSFGRAVADAYTDRNIAIIKVSQGGTSLVTDWSSVSNGYMYATFTNFVPIALQALVDEGASYTLRGMIWHQGESDGGLTTGEYETHLTDFISAVRDAVGVTNLPFVVGELATNRSASVRQAQYNVSQNDTHVGFASSAGLETLAPDDPHFTAASQILLGGRFAESAIGLVGETGIVWSGLETTNISSNSVWVSAEVDTNLTSTVLVWDTIDQGTSSTNAWPSANRVSMGGTNAGVVTAQINGLDADTQYSWRFYGENAQTNGWSTAETFATALSDAQAPVFTMAEPSLLSVTLSWQDNASNETGYVVLRSAGGNFVALETTAADATSFMDSVSGAGTYTYRLAATNSVSGSQTDPSLCETNVTVTFPSATPGEITILRAEGFTSTSGGGTITVTPAQLNNFDAQGSDKLVVTASGEQSGVSNNRHLTMTYGGVAMTNAMQYPDVDKGRIVSIWYLDDVTTSGDIVLTTMGSQSGIGLSALALLGTEPGVKETAFGSSSATLATAIENDLVIAAAIANGATLEASAPLIELFSGNTSSSTGAAGYGLAKDWSGAVSPSIAGAESIAAAAFVPVTPPAGTVLIIR